MHTHRPLLKLFLKILKKNFTGSKISIFGCGGNRDKGKRSKMGKIVEKFSDEVLITTDNPRFEDQLISIKILFREFQIKKKRVLFLIEKKLLKKD